MEDIGSIEQNNNEDPALDSSEALSGLLSVVNALCRENTENNFDENNDDDNCGNYCDKSNNSVLGNADDENTSNPLEFVPVFDKDGKQVNRDFSAEIKEKDMTSSDSFPCRSPADFDKQTHPPPKRPEVTQTSPLIQTNRIKTIDVSTYSLDETRIVTFPDVYSAVRRAGGTCSSLRSKVNKLGIVAKRFQPWQMTRLKHVGAVGLEVKCCSHIQLEEFIQIVQTYKDESLFLEKFNFLPEINLTCTTSKSLVDEKVIKVGFSCTDSKPSSMTSTPIHTFIVNNEIVVCTMELQQVFESLFGKVFCVSLTKLGVFQKKFTPYQLDDVMDFVDIDDSSVSSACFYVTKKDGERVFRYAEALFNVDQITVRWMEPLKLTTTDSALLKDKEADVQECSAGGAPLERSTSSIHAFTSDMQGIPEGTDRLRTVTETKKDKGIADYRPDPLCSSSDDSLDASSPLSDPSRPERSDLFEDGPLSDTKRNVDGVTGMTNLPLETSPSSLPGNENDQTASDMEPSDKCQVNSVRSQKLESSVDPSNTKSPFQPSSSALIQTSEGHPSSPDSEASSVTDLGSCFSIRTYKIDGNEVVCIPDIHKIVILLYGQSVQVGYYLQRLQIPTQRFSTVHVKRLKALNALNSKATLCTYILKSDAKRLLKMYDVFCTDSKAQQIQWSNPVLLDVFQGAIPFNEDIAIVSTENLKPKPADPVDVVRIPTFQINGEVVVSVPDAHKVVQVLNGQSVQVRYNMDKLGIVKRKYSYSQVYQLRAISDLKRPSMCTFITKRDADKLLAHYLTANNASRLNYIRWLPPVQLEELKTSVDGASTSQDVCISMAATVPEHDQNNESILEQETCNVKRTSDAGKDMESLVQEQGVTRLLAMPLTSKNNDSTFIRMPSSVVRVNKPEIHHYSDDQQQNYRKLDSASRVFRTLDSSIREGSPLSAVLTGTYNQGTMRDCSSLGPLETRAKELYNEDTARDSARYGSLLPRAELIDACYDQTAGFAAYSTCDEEHHGALLSRTESRGPYNQDTSEAFDEEIHPVAVHSRHGTKRLHEERRDKENSHLEIKKLKAEKDNIAANLERKETEMKILHDAYQQQVACEREKRLKADKEAAELRASNEELRKNLERKESEMKILHDSYQYQIQKEREKRDEMENELTDLRGSVTFASGVAVGESDIKQEKT